MFTPWRGCAVAKLAIIFIAACAISTQASSGIVLNKEVTQDTIQQTICVPGYTKQVRPPTSYTNQVKQRLLQEAGQPPEAAGDYELDHIVPLALGGHPSSPSNLMLQPWPEAKRKDRIEVKLQCLVCSGQVELGQAQREIFEDWRAAYARYSRMKCRR